MIRNLMSRWSWMLLIPLVDSMYLPLDHNNGHVHCLVTALDKDIPFDKIFAVPYAAWYLFIFALLIWFMFKDRDLYFTSILAIVTGLLISFAIFSVFQTAVPRPDVTGQDIFSRLTRAIYHFDAPYNDFPSIHVMTSFIIFLGCERAKTFSRRIPFLAQGMALLVMVSTLFLKQHTLLDVAGGLLLGGIIFTLSCKAVSALKMVETGSLGPAGWDKKIPRGITSRGLLFSVHLVIPVIFYALKDIMLGGVVKWFQSNQL